MKFKEKIIKKVTGTEMGGFKELLKEKFNQIDNMEKKIDEIHKRLHKDNH